MTSRAERKAREAAGIGAEPDGGDALAALEKENAAKEKTARKALDTAFGAFGFIVMPSDAEAPILDVGLRTTLHHWLYEMNAAAELKRAGLAPRTRCLLKGPPGCGKTMLAHHIAARLGVPMLVVQAHSVMSKWVNESGERIGKLFRAARRDTNNLALFFDEFDATAKDRSTKGGSGGDEERASITIAFLQEMDRYQGLLFAATNEPGKIDKAIWRRFQMQIEIGHPGEEERDAIVRLYMAPFVCDEETVTFLGDLCAGGSPALIREICEALKRMLVLAPKMQLSTDLPDMLRRLHNTIAPPEQAEPPAFWQRSSAFLVDAAGCPWPPVWPG